MKSAVWGITNQTVNLVLSFIYRTIFLTILSQEFLGLNNLFTSVLGVLSLAELGVGVAINYKMYAPVAERNVDKIAAYMNFYKKIYRIIILVIAVLGFGLLPFIKFFIKDVGSISAKVNVHLAYSLFILQVLSGYVCVYKQGLLFADQRGYTVSVIAVLMHIFRNVAQIVVLLLTREYIFTIVAFTCVTLAINIGASIVITKQYGPVFQIKNTLSKEEKKEVFKDTYALLCHKIGGTVLNSTDAVLITGFVGLAISGIYSNYIIISSAVMALMTQLLTTFIGSIGNLKITSDIEHEYQVYNRLLFLNFSITGFCFVEMFNLSNPFISLWLGTENMLSMLVVAIVCINFMIHMNRAINTTTITAVGLFVKDKIRPLIEAATNVCVSIGLIYLFGSEKLFGNFYERLGVLGRENMQLFGILLGTTISMLLLPTWREVYILHKYEFQKPQRKFYFKYAYFIFLTAVATTAGYFAVYKIPNTWGFWFLKVFVLFFIYLLVFFIFTFWMKDFWFFVDLFKSLSNKIKMKVKFRKCGKNGIMVDEGEMNDDNKISDDSDVNEDDNDCIDE